MAYFLQVKVSSDEYRTLNVSRSDKFVADNVSKAFTKASACSLQGLDHFTMQFASEEELRYHLLLSGILPPNLAAKPFVIRFATKKKVRNYNLFFMDDLQYFYPENLFELIENRYLSNDFKFFVNLAEYFCNFKECGATAAEVLALANMALESGCIDKGFNEVDFNGDKPITRLIKLLMFKYKTLPNNVVMYNESEFNWRTLHILIEFIKNYEQRERNFAARAAIITSYSEPKKKEKKKKGDSFNEQISGQLSYRDLPEY